MRIELKAGRCPAQFHGMGMRLNDKVMMGLLAALCLLLGLGSLAWAKPIVVVTEEWPPYSYSEDGEVRGLVTEIVRETMDRTGLEYEIRILPFVRAYRMAAEHEDVLIYTLFRLPSREMLFKWIRIDGLATQMYLYSPTGRPEVAPKSLDEARRFRVGVTRGTSTHHFLAGEGFVEGVNLFPVNCERQNILMSHPHNKRIDLSTGDDLSMAHWLMANNYPQDYWVKQVYLFSEDFYMAFGRKTSDEVVSRVSRAFGEVRELGLMQKAVARQHRLMQAWQGTGR